MNTPQLPLALRSQRAFRLDDFIGNAELCALLTATAHGDCQNGLFLHGPPDSGKTHLLLATMALARSVQRTVNYLPLRILAQAAETTLDATEGHALLCIDDVDAIAGHRATEEALFRLHNRAHDHGGTLIYSAKAAPQALPLSLPDLRSRLQHGLRFSLMPLDDQGRRDWLRQAAAARGMSIDDAVLDYLFRHYPRDLDGLLQVLDRLDRASLAEQRRITVPFVRSVLLND
jgi:DnaA family protein